VVLPADGRSERLLHQYLPGLLQARGQGGGLARTLKTVGVALPELEERLREWLGAEGDVEVSMVAVDGEAWVRLRARGATAADVLAAQEAKILARLGVDCYGRDDETLEQVIGRLLLERALTLGVAESCTGGLVGHRLTNVPGSSAYFERGVVVYSNRAKQELLGVPDATLRTHGAVSAPTAEAMARGIRAASGSGCALAVTGIAGPDGGTPSKPVGTVFIGVAVGDDVRAHRFVFPGDRAAIKWQSAQTALDLLRRRVLVEPVRR
jgi:nicotinamide-nucleotide amidase